MILAGVIPVNKQTITRSATVDALEDFQPLWHLDCIDQRVLPLDGVATLPDISPGVTIYVLDTGSTDHSWKA